VTAQAINESLFLEVSRKSLADMTSMEQKYDVTGRKRTMAGNNNHDDNGY
jgi:hypothetical protein